MLYVCMSHYAYIHIVGKFVASHLLHITWQQIKLNASTKTLLKSLKATEKKKTGLLVAQRNVCDFWHSLHGKMYSTMGLGDKI